MFFSIPVSLPSSFAGGESLFFLRAVSQSRGCVRAPLLFITAGQDSNILPIDYGGCLQPQNTREWCQKKKKTQCTAALGRYLLLISNRIVFFQTVFKNKSEKQDFPHGPLVKAPPFQCRGHRFYSWSGK